MKNLFVLFSLIFVNTCVNAQTPVYNAASVKALYAKYPTVKNTLCPGCRLWVNPFYKSIADTIRHMPICEYTVVTKQHRLMQEGLYASNKKIRSGIFASWFVVGNDVDVRTVYELANKQINQPMSINEVVYGHCGLCYVLAAWCPEGMFFSDAVDYNEGMEYQGQNIGTQIATEDTTRLLLGWVDPKKHKVNVVDSVQIWGGCYTGKAAKTYSFNGKTVTIPDYYWKIIKFGTQTVCYWMLNLSSESQDMLPKRHITYQNLVVNLGFDPEKVLHGDL